MSGQLFFVESLQHTTEGKRKPISSEWHSFPSRCQGGYSVEKKDCFLISECVRMCMQGIPVHSTLVVSDVFG